MRRFGALCIWSQGISQSSASGRRQLVALFLSFPCFEISHFFFKFAYALQERRLRLACGEDFFLKFYDRRVANGGVVDVLQSLRRIVQGLEDAKASQKFTRHDIRS